MSKKVLIIRGGPSSEYDVSLKTGKSILDALSEHYTLTDCIIDKNGDWYVKGFKNEPQVLVRNHDVVFNAMHGEYGEDGQVQRLLENLGAKFTGPKSLGASLAMNKFMAKKIFSDLGIKTPLHKMVSRNDNNGNLEQTALDIFRSLPMPVIIKPVDRGSSVGLTIARDYASLINSLVSLFVSYDRLLVEEYIPGKEATVGVIEEFRNQKHYALLPIEIKTGANDLFDYNAKYSGTTEEICPGNFSNQDKILLQELAVKAHQALGLRHYSRSDFIIHPKRGIYILETNSLPGLTGESLLPKSINAVGSSYVDFLKHIIESA
jgi:D-alanine--D-alanine ligase